MRFHPECRRIRSCRNCKRNWRDSKTREIGHRFTNLTLTDTQGEPISLSSLVEPGRWVLLDFWATWCAPCCHEIPHLREAYAAYKAKGV
ncbi:MAG: peroxiredoxin family protein [Alistipes onderdonkii]